MPGPVDSGPAPEPPPEPPPELPFEVLLNSYLFLAREKNYGALKRIFKLFSPEKKREAIHTIYTDTTLLHELIKNKDNDNRTEQLALLTDWLKSKPNVNVSKPPKLRSPIVTAFKNGDVEIFAILLEHGAVWKKEDEKELEEELKNKSPASAVAAGKMIQIIDSGSLTTRLFGAGDLSCQSLRLGHRTWQFTHLKT